MEKTIVQFIVNNIFLFLPIGIAGVVITAFLFFFPNKEGSEQQETSISDTITFHKFRVNFYIVIYVFIWMLIGAIGLLSDFILPTLSGTIIAAIPLVLLFLLRYKNIKES